MWVPVCTLISLLQYQTSAFQRSWVYEMVKRDWTQTELAVQYIVEHIGAGLALQVHTFWKSSCILTGEALTVASFQQRKTHKSPCIKQHIVRYCELTSIGWVVSNNIYVQGNKVECYMEWLTASVAASWSFTFTSFFSFFLSARPRASIIYALGVR